MSSFEELTDDKLYRSYLQGETSAYDHLMIRHGDSLVMYLYGYLRDFHEAEDLMIEAFARIMAKRPSIRSGNFKAYLFRTGRNLALRFNERSRRQAFSLDGMESDVAENFIAANVYAKAESKTISQRIADDERNEALRLCLDRIEPELRESLWLVYVEGLSYAEAASVMGLKGRRIDRLLAKGKQSMRDELMKEGVTNIYG